MARKLPQQRTPEEEAKDADNSLLAKVSARSLLNYISLVKIDGSRGPRPFGAVMEPWQRRSTIPILRAIEGVAGISSYAGPTCFWRDLPQGHDKTSSIARILNGALAFARKPVRIGVFARDTDQANRIHKFMKDESRLNPWLGSRLEFQIKRVRSVTGSEVEIHDADASANAGHKFGVTILEELTWWPEKGELLFNQLYSRRLKIEGGVFIVLGNAGIESVAAPAVRTVPARSALGHLPYRWDGSRLAGQGRDRAIKRTMIPSLARRIFDNQWIDETEQTYLTRAEIDRVHARARELGLRLHDAAEPGVKYVCSVDYGARKDWCAAAVVGIYRDGTVRVVKLDVWMARDFDTGEVPVEVVREWVFKQNKNFRNPDFVFDEYQLLSLIQECECKWGKRVHRHDYRGGITNAKMAEHVRNEVVNLRLLWPENAGLVMIEDAVGRMVPYTLGDEFHDLVTKDMPTYGQRWDHKAQKHDDRCVVVGMAAYFAAQIDQSRPFDTTGVIPVIETRKPVEAYLQPHRDRHTIYGE